MRAWSSLIDLRFPYLYLKAENPPTMLPAQCHSVWLVQGEFYNKKIHLRQKDNANGRGNWSLRCISTRGHVLLWVALLSQPNEGSYCLCLISTFLEHFTGQ